LTSRIFGESVATMPTAAREQLIETHLPLVRAVALRFARRGEPLDDLVQAGAVGLIRAVDRYEAGRGSSFEAYAVPTISGEIRRHLRDRCATVRIPRRAYEDRSRIELARLELESRTGRPAQTAEVARAAGVPAAAVIHVLGLPLTQPLDEEAGSPIDPIGELHDRLALAAALRRLPQRERRVLLLAFYGERSQRRIAVDLGLSQVHVSRLLRSALARLRAGLEEGAESVAAAAPEA
jgi:RNA polymerase sigma-B factor